MKPEVIGIVGLVVLFILLAKRMWIGAAMAGVGFIGIVLIKGFSQALTMSFTAAFKNVVYYPMTAVPMFTLMGIIIAETQIGTELYEAAHKWIGHLKGGLASATIVVSGLLGAITGSTITAISVLGKVALPEMEKYKYDDKLACGSIAAGAPLSIMIPPSLPFILYGLLTEQSIGKLFIAGIGPGVLEVFIFVIVISILCRINPKLGPSSIKPGLKERILSLKNIAPMLAIFVLIMGGIYGGFFSATEAGAIGVFGAFIYGIIRRRFSRKNIVNCVVETGLVTGMVFLLIAGVYIFSAFMTVSRLPIILSNFIVSLNLSITFTIVVIAILYLVLGCFLPEYAMVLLTIPILYPVILAMGIDPIWFGVIVVKMMMIGSITPPIGMSVFLLAGVANKPVTNIFRGVVPFIIASAVVTILIIAFPQIALYLPSMM